MLRKIALALFCSLTITLYGCFSGRAPLVSREISSEATVLADTVAQASWTLDSLRPPEKTVLIDGQVTPVSITMTASGNGQYSLGLSVAGRHFRPFLLGIQQGPGQIDFASKITWYLKPKGKSETIDVNLYRIDTSTSGKTKVTTLLKQVRRTYDVVCNEKECGVILFFKKHVFCSCRVK